MNSFVDKFSSHIVATLSCFDRVRFTGTLPFRYAKKLEGFVDYELDMKRKDFIKNFVKEKTDQLVDHAKRLGAESPGGYEYVQGKCRKKDDLVLPILREHRITEGLICVRGFQECCRSFKLSYGQGRPGFKTNRRPQCVMYYYYLHRDLGLMSVRQETWFPFTVQVTINGHEWLARQMQKKGMEFCLQDNAFTKLDDPQKAQKLADRFPHLNWVKILNGFARRVNPLLRQRWLKGWNQHYWVTDQAEYATDLIFTSRQSLADLYPRLMDHATLNFSAHDILGFLGRRLHWKFDGEVMTDCKKDRWPGARVGHQMKNNRLKMYDKFGLILRIETVINNSREFKVRRRKMRDGVRRMVWCPMNKGVSNMYRYQQVSHAANERYLQALTVVENPAPAYRQLKSLATPKISKRRSYAGFNPAKSDDVAVFAAVLQGNNLIHGFRNADVRRALFGEPRGFSKVARDQQRRRHSGRVTRLLKKLHVRNLIAKVPRTRRWHATASGQELLGVAVRLYHRDLPAELDCAA
ncbi:MAG: hypothetical protein QGF59_10000 [Pirellulaceae bacterium]|jgi:hypothetical protein|nr:hypothetical protein [Pirellulaceae bacterium]